VLGYRRIRSELLVLGTKIAASTVWEILSQAGIDPAPEHTTATWASFLRSQAGALLAGDFFETRLYVLAVVEHASRRIPDAGCDSSSQCILGRPGREKPGHGSRGRREPGAVHNPGTATASSSAWSTPSSLTPASKRYSAGFRCRE
jgi:hypothetical protein